MTWRGGGHPDELISASLTGDLTDAERAELDAHLVRCERCRATLAAFGAERRILSGLPVADPPRDLSARVRTGIESGRSTRPWGLRRGVFIAIGGSVATAAIAVLAVLAFNNLAGPPVGQTTASPHASSSVAPSATAVQSTGPTAEPTPAPILTLGPGELGYLSVTGAPFKPSRLTFIDDANGASIDAGTVTGPPIAAALSPDGRWLAYITQKGETGANEVWTLSLVNGDVKHLGCSTAAPFTDRLAWSPDSRYLAFTLVGVNLGPNAGCQQPGSGADVWLFDARTAKQAPFTSAGNAYAADFASNSASGEPQLWVSFAAAKPQSSLLAVPGGGSAGSGGENGNLALGVFLPLLSPDGNRAIFWTGTMTSNGGSWHFSLGGMPQLSADLRSVGPASPWIGAPLFTDLIPVGGEAFADGSFTWGHDSDLMAFWNGAWTGPPQGANGTYPGQQDVYLGRLSTGLLTSGSRVKLVTKTSESIVDVAIRSDGGIAVTVRRPIAGIGDPPSAYLEIVSSDSLGIGGVPPRWAGPAVYGP
jgi:Putative zinc-finger/WD40-like Beta Propeller Repeat